MVIGTDNGVAFRSFCQCQPDGLSCIKAKADDIVINVALHIFIFTAAGNEPFSFGNTAWAVFF